MYLKRRKKRPVNLCKCISMALILYRCTMISALSDGVGADQDRVMLFRMERESFRYI